MYRVKSITTVRSYNGFMNQGLQGRQKIGLDLEGSRPPQNSTLHVAMLARSGTNIELSVITRPKSGFHV